MARWSVLLAIPPVLAGVATAAWLISTAPGPAQEDRAADGLAVRVAAVVPQDIAPVVRGWGSVRAATTWAAIAEVRGQVIWRHPDLEAGKLIAAGTEVLKIDPTDYELAIAQGQADLSALSAEETQLRAEQDNTRRILTLESERLQIAQADLTRTRNLVTQGVAPQTRADDAEKAELQIRRVVTELQNSLDLIPARLERLAAQQARTKAAIGRARRDLDHSVLKAPFDVRISAVGAELYQSVSVGQMLVQANGVARAEVVVQVPLPAFRRLLVPTDGAGDALTAIGAGPSGRMAAQLHPLIDPAQIWQATVSRVEGALDPKARTVPVVVTVDNPYADAAPPVRLPLVPNMQVEVALTGAPLHDVITIPEGALHGGTVYVVSPGDQLELRPVSVAFRQDGVVVLRDGLATGERIVLDDIAPALPGMALHPVSAADTQEATK